MQSKRFPKSIFYLRKGSKIKVEDEKLIFTFERSRILKMIQFWPELIYGINPLNYSTKYSLANQLL
jgi:hypothetical protein